MALVKSSEIARRYGVTRHAVQDWIRRGLVPASIITRVGGSVLIDDQSLAVLIREGKVFRRPRGVFAGKAQCIGEDSVTTKSRGNGTEHRWTNDSGSCAHVQVVNHPYSPELRSAAVLLNTVADGESVPVSLCREISDRLYGTLR